MNGNVEFEGDLYTILDVILRHINKFSTKFENVDAVLKESGLFLLHYISGIKESEGDAWIKKYIFPGGVIPTLREIIYISAEYNYHTIDVESLRMHYTFGVEKGYKCWYYTQFKGNYLFHSIIYNLDGSIRDGRLGMKLSDGCIRLAKVNAKWIYDNVPAGSTVYIE